MQQLVRGAALIMACAAVWFFTDRFAAPFVDSARAQQPERRVALIIGNSAYVSVPKLENPGPTRG